MNTLKSFIFHRFNTLAPLFLLCSASLFLLMVRLKLTHSFFYLFLVWNLVLAAIPFAVTLTLNAKEKASKLFTISSFGMWLLFLPNAPYIITDLIHLQLSSLKTIWFDALLISVFSISGLAFYVVSVAEMKKQMLLFFSEKLVNPLFWAIPFLCGFGIYLGRVLRFNSWDIISNPLSLLKQISEIIIYPMENYWAWVLTIGFGVLLLLCSHIFKKVQ